MYLKIAIFVTLLTIIVASPSPHHHRRHHHGKVGHHHRRYCYKGKKVLGCFGYFAKGVNRKCGHSYNIFTDLSNYNDKGNFDSSLEAILSLCKASGDIVDYQFRGLGEIFQKLALSSHRILFCVPTFWRKKHRCGVCNKDYGKHWGWSPYQGKYDSYNNVIEEYDLFDSKSEIEKIINDCTGGKGIEGLTGTQRIVAKYIWDLSCLFDRDYKWHSDDFYKIFYRVLGIIAALGNSRRVGLGDYVVDGMIKYCGESIKDYGYPDVSSCHEDIKKEIENCSQDGFEKAISNSSGEDEPEFDTDTSNNQDQASTNVQNNNHQTIIINNIVEKKEACNEEPASAGDD